MGKIYSLWVTINEKTTDYSVKDEGNNIIHKGAIRLCYKHIISDVSLGLKVEPETAKKLIENGEEILETDIDKNRTIKAGKKDVKAARFKEIMEARIEEIFTFAQEKLIQDSVFENISQGYIEMNKCYLKGMETIMSRVMNIPVTATEIEQSQG